MIFMTVMLAGMSAAMSDANAAVDSNNNNNCCCQAGSPCYNRCNIGCNNDNCNQFKQYKQQRRYFIRYRPVRRFIINRRNNCCRCW